MSHGMASIMAIYLTALISLFHFLKMYHLFFSNVNFSFLPPMIELVLGHSTFVRKYSSYKVYSELCADPKEF